MYKVSGSCKPHEALSLSCVYVLSALKFQSVCFLASISSFCITISMWVFYALVININKILKILEDKKLRNCNIIWSIKHLYRYGNENTGERTSEQTLRLHLVWKTFCSFHILKTVFIYLFFLFLKIYLIKKVKTIFLKIKFVKFCLILSFQ